MRLKLIGGRFPHHATHSGYHRIAEFLGVECHASSDATLPAADLLDFIYADAGYR